MSSTLSVGKLSGSFLPDRPRAEKGAYTMIVKRRLNMERKPRKPLTEEEIAEIEARAPRDEDIAYDEDCPPSTPEQLV